MLVISPLDPSAADEYVSMGKVSTSIVHSWTREAIFPNAHWLSDSHPAGSGDMQVEFVVN
jgi:hypothetical protein